MRPSHTMNQPFANRTIQSVSDLSIDEQYYLYRKIGEYKRAIQSRDYDYIQSHIIDSNNFATYLLFQEHSTRTKESFYNAACFHQVRVKDVSLNLSSLEKHETFTDTVKTLLGYAEHSCFIIRSRIEGICQWLGIALESYANRCGIPIPFCINAGDGSNEHPTQELLDQFTFHEYYKGDRSYIHIALIGDLLHGRTVHSKSIGLRVFREVKIDLVAPMEIAMPTHYISEMKNAGFEIRVFESLEEYIHCKSTASLWYFTRLQRERIEDILIPHIDRIHSKISFQSQYLHKIPDHITFLHPLPRDKLMPTIPYSMDHLPLNGWDQQSINGYYTRITLLSMLKGIIGEDFEGTPLEIERKQTSANFIIDKPIQERKPRKENYKIGIKPVHNGLVIDHIAKGQDIRLIWNRIDLIRRIMNFNIISSHGVYRSHITNEYKGILSIPDYIISELADLKKLGAISPGCTINVIKKRKVIKKMHINQPPRIYNFSEISCRNPRCISYEHCLEHAFADFFLNGDGEYLCNYCKTSHHVNEIWNTSSYT